MAGVSSYSGQDEGFPTRALTASRNHSSRGNARTGSFDSRLAGRISGRWRLARVDSAGPQRNVADVLLERVRDPAGRAGHGEDGLSRPADHSRHVRQHREREVDIGLGQGAAAHLGQDGVRDGEPRGSRRRTCHEAEQADGTRVAVLVHEVPEAGYPARPAQQLTHPPRRVGGGRGGREHALGPERRAAVQRAAERAEAGRHHGVGIRPDRGGHPRRQRGRGELVVGEQHDRRRIRADRAPQPDRDAVTWAGCGHARRARTLRARAPGARAPRALRPRGTSRFLIDGYLWPTGGPKLGIDDSLGDGRCRRRGEAVDHACDEGVGGGDHRGTVQVQPQRVGGGQRGRDHLQPLQRQRPGGQCGLRRGPGRDGFRGGLPGGLRRRAWCDGLRWCATWERRGEVPGPEQGGDVLEELIRFNQSELLTLTGCRCFRERCDQRRIHEGKGMTQTQPGIDVRRVAGHIGAELTGIRVGADLPGPILEIIRSALYEHKVIFFRGQDHLDDESQSGFARLFGYLTQPHPTVPGQAEGRNVLSLDAQRGGGKANAWHTDVTFVDRPPALSFLRAVTLPPYGGDTAWANTAAAYQSLAPDLRELAERQWALHSNDYDYIGTRGGGMNAVAPRDQHHHQDVFLSTVYEPEHPVVRVRPVTGERALLLGQFVRHILGVLSADARYLFELFQRHVTRLENTVRWQWAPGDLAVWDNRATQHYAIDDYGDLPRRMHRVTVAGDVPVSTDGRRSVARAGDATVYAGAAG